MGYKSVEPQSETPRSRLFYNGKYIVFIIFCKTHFRNPIIKNEKNAARLKLNQAARKLYKITSLPL